MGNILEAFVSDENSLDGWFPLQRSDHKLWLHADTFAKKSVSMKRITVSNVYIPGTFTVRAVPDNTTEIIGVYVQSDDPDERESIADYLVSLFTRVSFTIMTVEEGRSVLMTGQAADYSKDTSREYLHAGTTLLMFSACAAHQEGPVISSDLSEMLLSYVLVDQYSPFIDTGFSVSLHQGGTSSGLTGELTYPSYARGSIGCGPGFWEVGARSAVNQVDVYFPMTAADEMWRGVRMAGLWSVGTTKFLFGYQLDESGIYAGSGDRLYIPAGGLVFGFV